jgi:hypothetical protein
MRLSLTHGVYAHIYKFLLYGSKRGSEKTGLFLDSHPKVASATICNEDHAIFNNSRGDYKVSQKRR